MDETEIQARKDAFNTWLRESGTRIGYYQLPPSVQDRVHYLLKLAYNAGSNRERRLAAPACLGGVD